jgi:outer membrane protein assembly factor BamB
MSRVSRLMLFGALAACLCAAATTAVWEIDGYQDFLRGRMSGLSITPDGRLVLGPKLDTFFSSDQPQIWSVAQAPDGSLYLGTGNRGRLMKVDAAGKGSVAWSADQPEIFAVAVDRAGVVYAGTSPDGKVYRIENGKATEYFAPGERYIWALAFAPDGALFVATGQQGKIFRVTAAGRGDVYYETGQAHVTCLAFDREGRLLAGSEPNGILYRITGSPAKGFVLYDANLPEIRTIVPLADGSIYAAALGGSVARRTGAASGAVQSTGGMLVAPPMSITVTDAQAGPSLSPKPEAPKPAAAPAIAAAAAVTEVSGVEKSALYKILPDNTVETLWSSKEENIYDVVAENGGTLLFFTDAQGRIYRIDPRPDRGHQATLVAQSNEGDATRLIASQRGAVLAATGNAGKILRLDAGAGSSGWFESPVHDSGTVARWGRLTWVGDSKAIAFRTRAGNSARPDATWSDWSAPIDDPAKSLITSPNARYIQWRAEFSGAAWIDSVRIAYLPQNTPPTVRSITVSAQAASAAKSAVGSTVYSVTVTDTADGSATAGSQGQTLSRPAGQQIQVTWQADDPEGDKLSYSLFFRGEDEREWKLLRANISENTYLLDADVFADGRYFFKVIASDRPSNPADQARQAELVGPPVLIDNTPPQVTAGAVRRTGSTIEIDVDAEDRASALRRCEYSVDASPWLPVEASDGVTDSPRERFLIHIDNFPAGEHLIVIRAYDSAGNAGLTKVVVR